MVQKLSLLLLSGLFAHCSSFLTAPSFLRQNDVGSFFPAVQLRISHESINTALDASLSRRAALRTGLLGGLVAIPAAVSAEEKMADAKTGEVLLDTERGFSLSVPAGALPFLQGMPCPGAFFVFLPLLPTPWLTSARNARKFSFSGIFSFGCQHVCGLMDASRI